MKNVFFNVVIQSIIISSVALSSGAVAQTYPDKPIRMIVPAPAGGGTDILGRLLADGLSKRLNKPVVVENRGGASGMIAVEQLLNAPHDGYTLLMVFSGIMTVNKSLYKDIKYDPIKDMVAISNFAEVPNVLIVNPSFPAKSVKELIELAKAKPGSINYASSGNGVSNHLAMELFKQMTDTEMAHIPYRGGAPAMIDLMGGQVQVMFNNMVEVTSQSEAGKVRILAIGTPERSTSLPDVPTIAESGVPGYEISLWYGLVGGSGIPAPIVEKLNAAVHATQNDPEVQARLAKMGAQPVVTTSEQFDSTIKQELEKWAKVIEVGKIQVD